MIDQSKMEKIISLCKRRGFVFPSSEIYGGVGGIWDFGPLGVLLKNNIKNLWWKKFVQERDDVVGLEGSIIMNPSVWKASGHIESFTDPLVECKECHARYRADHMQDGRYVGEGKAKEANQCTNCGKKEFTEAKNFNMMFKTFIGSAEDSASATYLRPETAQSMFTNFRTISETNRKKLPFGIAQVGKCFRNEITYGNFFFRSREFEIAEIEYFVKPGEDEEWFNKWLSNWKEFVDEVGIKKENIREYEHPKKGLAHYSKRTVDLEYNFPFSTKGKEEWSELMGVANRTDFDLKQHNKFSKKDLEYFDPITNEKLYPYVIEPTLGVDRLMLAILVDAFEEVQNANVKDQNDKSETKNNRENGEIVLHLDPKVAPYKLAILPLVKKDENLLNIAKKIRDDFRQFWFVDYDESGSIGRRYRRQDEIGTPYCVTVDFDSLEDDSVTVRDRDTMKQERIKIKDLPNYFMTKIC